MQLTRRYARSRLLGSAAFLLLLAGCEHESAGPATSARSESNQALVRFSAGEQYEYSLELRSKLSTGGAEGELDLTLAARLSVTALATTSDLAPGVEPLRMALADVNFSSEHAGPGAFSALTRELEAGFVVERRDGSVTRISMARPSLFAANLAQSIAAELALGPAPAAGIDHWEGAGSDATGSFVTAYRTTDDGLQLHKLRYTPQAVGKLPGSSNQLTLSPQVVSSLGNAHVVAGELRSSTYQELLVAPLMTAGTARSETSITLALLRHHATAAPSYAAARVGMVDVNSARATALPGDAAELARSKIGSFTLASASQKLLELTREPLLLDRRATERESPREKSARERRVADFNQAFAALTAILQTDASAVDSALQLLRADAARATFSIDALAGAGTAQAQAALVALANDASLPVELRRRAEGGIVSLETPTFDTLEVLLGWLVTPEHRINAIYGLGTQARHLREAGQLELAARASRALAEQLARSRGSGERVHLLRGIANSGDASLLGGVKPLLKDSDPVLRGAALESMRLMDSPEVDELIAQSLRNEQSFETLRAAVNAARVRAPSDTLIGAISDVARGSEDSQTRYRATQLLASWLGKRPEVRSVLGDVAQSELNEDIRAVASHALAST